MSKVLELVKQLDNRYQNITIEKATYESAINKLTVVFVLSIHFDENDVFTIKRCLQQCFNSEIDVKIKKVMFDNDLAVKQIISFLENNYPSVKERIGQRDIVAKMVDDNAVITIFAESEVCEYLEKKDFFSNLDTYLKRHFCNNFTFEFKKIKDKEVDESLFEEKVDYTRIEQIPLRKYKVSCVTRLFDNNTTDEVLYIADALEHTGDTAIAGKIISIKQKETKNGKLFYIIELSDTTGRMSGTVFSTKEIIRKMEKLQEGCEVVACGKSEISNGYHRFTIKSLNLCEFPKDFKYEERASRKAPESYLIVKPEPVEQIRQANFFNLDDKIPPCLIGKTFVVIDLETTGISPQDDKITEIGAVKMVDGVIIEKFATMVNPERKIPKEVVELTGITDDMVANAPTFGDVAGDLYKFCHNTIIVAHNLSFDYTFVKNMSKPLSYVYENLGMDTLAFARQVVQGLPNYKLNTICEKFGIEFLHHRAYSDALATCEMFIELVKLKGGLPD